MYKTITFILLIAILLMHPGSIEGQEAPWIKADPMCQLLSASVVPESLSRESQTQARVAFNQGATIFLRYREAQDSEIVNNALPFLEEAVRIDRTNDNFRNVLLTAYKILANKATQDCNYKEAILFGERMIRVNATSASDYTILFALGNNYFKFQKYDYAILHFGTTEKIINKEIEKKPDDNKLRSDKCTLHNLLYNIYIERNEFEKAVKEVEKGKKCANTEQWIQRFQQLDQINLRRQFWGGDEGLNLEIEISKQKNLQNFNEVVNLYQQLINLFPDSNDVRKIEAIQLYSLFRFQNLKQKAETIEYLLPWIDMLSNTSPESISTYQSLYDCFSLMNYNLGMERLAQNRFESYCYLRQALTVSSNHSDKVHFGLLTLCRQNPTEVIRLGNLLLNEEGALDDDKKRVVLEYLIYAYKFKNQVEEVKHLYEMYQALFISSTET
ncbi:hypothetical protein HQ585_14440 [candidate division KSB1 bacterium]|nr:hypothetical protein [candidate division KSB1 bacterium]